MPSRARPSWPPVLAAASATALALLAVSGPARPGRDGPHALAAALRRAYADDARPGERWRRRPTVRLADGREVPRELALRDDPKFVEAAGRLLRSRRRDDAPLGAWLLGTASPAQAAAARRELVTALGHADPRVAFEAVLALARGRDDPAAAVPGEAGAALQELARTSASADVQTAAAWAAGQIPPKPGGLPPGFRRGVCWWMSEGRADQGAASFRRLASLGVDWVSIHSWDPLQRGIHEPRLAEPDRRFGLRDLDRIVRNAHAVGIRVMVKPHLEMRGHQPSEEERRVLRGSDEAARQALFRRLEARFAGFEPQDHGRIEMRSEADWQLWFAGYERYLLAYARQAQQAGADAFCVGREIDRTVRLRERDWRALIAKVRHEFKGPLTYSANFDGWQGIGIWDALDFIGISAYFPLSSRPDPSLAELEAGWARVLQPLEAARRRWERPILLTEVGFPSVPTAARAPWKEERVAADAWLQARCYEATLRALARRPAVEGAFLWLWERSAQPAFRDPSHAIVDKPASFTMARWYARAPGAVNPR